MSALIQTTLRRINSSDESVSKWSKYAVSFRPNLDNRSKIRYDVVENIMTQIGIPRHAFLFNGVNIVTQIAQEQLGNPYSILHSGQSYQVTFERLNLQEEYLESKQPFLEIVNRVFSRAMDETGFLKIRDKYIVKEVGRQVFNDTRAELFKGFTLTVDMLGADTVVLKHKIVHRLMINQTLDQPGIEIEEGDELQSIYDHKNTYFYVETFNVNIDKPMNDDTDFDQTTYREYYVRKFQLKLEQSALKRALWEKCLRYIQQSPAIVAMVKCHHTRDMKICNLFKNLSTKVEIPADILQNVSVASRVKTSDRFDEVATFIALLDSNRRDIGGVSALQALESWGISIGGQINTRTVFNSKQPTLKIDGRKQKDRDLVPQYMRDIKLSTPIPIRDIGVFYQAGAKSVFDAFWGGIKAALDQKNGGPSSIKDVKFFELKGKRGGEILDEVKRARPGGPFHVSVFFLAGDKFYDALKKGLTGDFNVVTQMIQAQNQRRNIKESSARNVIIHNIALQVLCKLGACPWTIMVPLENKNLCPDAKLNMLILGIDVSHGKKRFDNEKKVTTRMSYIGLSAYFMERGTTTFFGQTIQQKAGQEKLSDGKLTAFLGAFLNDAHFPSTVVVFRDGVDKGQIEAVREVEVNEILKCLKAKAVQLKKTVPKLAFTVATKRISEDFALDNGKKAPEGGLAVIDPLICSDREFYLIADRRTRCVHYNLIHTDGITRQDIIQLAYDTSFAYFNWPGPIKVPAALQYAHTISKVAGEHFDTEIKCQTKEFSAHKGLLFI